MEISVKTHSVRGARPERWDPQPTSPSNKTPAREEFVAASSDRWDCALSLGGGLLSVSGALTGRPLLTAAGALMTAAGTTMTARRVQAQGAMDTAAWVSFAGGGALTVAGGLLTLSPLPSPQSGPSGPLPQLLERLGVQAL